MLPFCFLRCERLCAVATGENQHPADRQAKTYEQNSRKKTFFHPALFYRVRGLLVAYTLASVTHGWSQFDMLEP